MKAMLLGTAVLGAMLAAPVTAATIDRFATLNGEAPILIAHRGASGYLPEHTIAAYELGIQMGADYIEPDLQLTADGHVVVMHDGTLNRSTNVEELFEARNGGYAVKDFTLDEIRTLTAEPTRTATNEYPGFSSDYPFVVPTFDEVLVWLDEYNAENGTDIGIYPESKAPYNAALNTAIAQSLSTHGYTEAADKVILQSFSFDSAEELAALTDSMMIDATIAQLGSATLLDGVFGMTYGGEFRSLEALAEYVEGLGVSISSPALGAEFISAAHDLGLVVHGWTWRPTSLEEAFAQIQPLIEAGIDGIFTDYPDLGRAVIDANMPAPVPLPAALPMLLAGLGGLAVLRRRRK
ncbi:glycerophosphodiester phosphodiesterase family protein [Falsirhodobacter xinxiangensis]|uniref:glycerophosphodiester phosphodiesterase family protein n=1 Tax=Falsirhodobacter xinxiangensis TaxID=2530049 RepID=UPI0010AB073D|nr:glycerophosphodiester phosphodiesterase family protein [Rhodobacter xinxiangensis]